MVQATPVGALFERALPLTLPFRGGQFFCRKLNAWPDSKGASCNLRSGLGPGGSTFKRRRWSRENAVGFTCHSRARDAKIVEANLAAFGVCLFRCPLPVAGGEGRGGGGGRGHPQGHREAAWLAREKGAAARGASEGRNGEPRRRASRDRCVTKKRRRRFFHTGLRYYGGTRQSKICHSYRPIKNQDIGF